MNIKYTFSGDYPIVSPTLLKYDSTEQRTGWNSFSHLEAPLECTLAHFKPPGTMLIYLSEFAQIFL